LRSFQLVHGEPSIGVDRRNDGSGVVQVDHPLVNQRACAVLLSEDDDLHHSCAGR
jgi:hypothetical protein